jgi:transcriptional regulator with GAF, ATPase, and Fis domain
MVFVSGSINRLPQGRLSPMAFFKKKLSINQKKFIAVLSLFDVPVPIDAIISITPISHGELLKVMDILKREDELKYGEDQCYKIRNGIRLLNAMDSDLNQDDWAGILNGLEGIELKPCPHNLAKLYIKAGMFREASILSYQEAFLAFENRDIAKAKALLELVFSSFSKVELSEATPDLEFDKLFISSALLFSDISVQSRRDFSQAIGYLQQAAELAEVLGSKRQQAMIVLHMGRNFQHLHMLNEALNCLKKGIKMVKHLGDEDILSQAAEFMGIYFFIKGLPHKALAYFEKVLETSSKENVASTNESLPVYLGNCLAFMGQFHRAIGFLDAHWHMVVINSNLPMARLLHAALGNVLLMAGHWEKGMYHLEACINDAQENGSGNTEDPWSVLWAQRSMAYGYFLKGQLEKAYDLMTDCLSTASQKGLPKPFYALPWMLEILYAFHKEGFEPIANHEYTKELETTLKGANIHLRGVAYRLKALPFIESKNTDLAIENLNLAIKDLKHAGDPVALAKSYSDLAICMLRENNKEEAKKLSIKAIEGFSALETELLPSELKLLIENEEHAINGDDNKHDLIRFIDMLEALIPRADKDGLLSDFVSAVARFLKAERGGLFFFTKHKGMYKNTLEATYNLSRKMTESQSFRENLLAVFDVFKKQTPILNPGMDSGRSSLYLPVETENKGKAVLFFGNSYGNELLDSLTTTAMEAVIRYAGQYIQWVHKYCRQMEDDSILTIKSVAGEDIKPGDLKYSDKVMTDFMEKIDQVAVTDVSVLVMGESGVGKELIVKRIHATSPRKEMPFIAVHLASIPESLMESELFGHEKGAFTGADRQKLGRFELANKGTLFLDEIGEIPLYIQVKILRVIQEKTFVRVGGVKQHNIDFRLITATNRDLEQEVEAGRFRKDLLYRLNVMPFVVPALRERDDLEFLCDCFLKDFAKKYNYEPSKMCQKDLRLLKTYSWPGNVRELKNIIERFVITTVNGGEFEFSDIMGAGTSDSLQRESIIGDYPGMDELQRRYIAMVIKKTNGKISGENGAAQVLGIKRTTLYSRMKKLGMSLP